MANDNRASYFRVGLTVLMGVGAILAVLVYIGGVGGRGDELLVETYYDKPVGGLAVGSQVNFRGVKIGEVRKISFIGGEYDVPVEDDNRIYLRLALDLKLIGCDRSEVDAAKVYIRDMVKRGLRATVASNAITGLARIECDFQTPVEELPNLSWQPRLVLIPPKASLLDNFQESATKVMNQINRIDLNAFWSNISASVESISAASLSTRHLVEGYQPEIERTLRNLEDATSSLRGFAEQIKMDPSMLLKGVQVNQLPETAP